MDNVMRLVRENIRTLAPYSTARDEYKGDIGVFLDANENPYNNGYNRYPDPRQSTLKELLSQIKGIAPQSMFIGNGSDEAIDLCFRIFCEPRIDNVVTIAPTYGMYRVAAAINDVEVREVQLGDDFSLPTAALLSACDQNTKLMFVCSPNNPTGNSFSIEQIRWILEYFDGVLVIDEAYIDFASEPSLTTLLSEYDNLIVLQTLSKAYGLAALRLGIAFAHPQIMQLFANVKYPYNINLAGMERAAELLKRDVAAEVESIKSERERVAQALEAVPCVKRVYPSDANFLLVKVDDAKEMYNKLIAAEVIVRDRSGVQGCEGCLRITIGTPDENEHLLQIMRN
ncbi:MAG: histidinol-phosphate transaminase [Bacteroidaceae bacterium]|nr:histidinol-phosphate transaminase [Bacteroidaceae bacterium]